MQSLTAHLHPTKSKERAVNRAPSSKKANEVARNQFTIQNKDKVKVEALVHKFHSNEKVNLSNRHSQHNLEWSEPDVYQQNCNWGEQLSAISAGMVLFWRQNRHRQREGPASFGVGCVVR